ncbi:MAG: LLM class flavin-dependent oxidoreductase [Pseudomonadota bacterium]
MKFQLVINMERFSTETDMRQLERDILEMVQVADDGGFEIVWAAEHHALELTIAPNPFQQLTWWAAHTNRIHLGTAVVVAAYWHPIRLAGEAALCDLYSGGRLHLGLGSGAYQREFDRMVPGLPQNEAYKHMHEMLPVLKELWKGDYEHSGEFWQFPRATSVPKPLQDPHPPIWVAARAPITYDWAVQNECNIMSWALTRPFSEVETYMQRFEDALAKAPEKRRPIFSTMRYVCVVDREENVDIPLNATVEQTGRFENLFKNLGGVEQGFAEGIDLETLKSRDEFDSESMVENLIFGTPDTVIKKLKRYEDLGVDQFTYNSSYGLNIDSQKKSLRMFVDEVMPAFI